MTRHVCNTRDAQGAATALKYGPSLRPRQGVLKWLLFPENIQSCTAIDLIFQNTPAPDTSHFAILDNIFTR